MFKKLMGIVVVLGAIFGGLFGWVYFQAAQLDLPPLHSSSVSTVYASDGKTVLGRIAAADVHESSQLTDAEVSPLIRQAHMAAEDRTFYEHGAVSIFGAAKAFWIDAKTGSLTAGGSTITQQYVKNAYLTQEKTFERKKNEVIYAYRVEKDFTKDQILTKYVNSNYYGRGAYGIEDASRTWFGVPAKKLTDMNDPLQVARAAFLAALIKQPSYYALYGKGDSPSNLLHEDELLARQRYVLDGFREVRGVNQSVSADVIQKAKDLLPLRLTDTVKPSGKTADGDLYLVNYVRDWLVAWQTQVAIGDGLGKDAAAEQGRTMAEAMLARGGLQVVTSLNARLQKQLDISAQWNAPGQGLSHGAVIMNPRTGGVAAMHSGTDGADDSYNYALYADRQVGSVMKTVVLADAVRSGISPYSVLPAPAYIEIDGSRIYNEDRRAAPGCRQTLADAIATSNNPVHIELITGKMASCRDPGDLQDIEPNYPVSPKSVANLARQMGADDSLVPGRSNPAKLPEVPTLALGVGTMTPVKVATIGSTLANGGNHTAPHLVEQVTAIDGQVVYQHEFSQTQVLGGHEVDVVNRTLTGVFAPGGTAEDSRVEGHPMAGKTGTTPTDAWGLMYSAVDGDSPAYVCAAWAGYADNRQTADDLHGASVMRLCRGFFRQALKDVPRVDFPMIDSGGGRYIGLKEEEPQAELDPTTPEPEPTTDSPSPPPTFTEPATPTPTPSLESPSPDPSSSSEEPFEPDETASDLGEQPESDPLVELLE